MKCNTSLNKNTIKLIHLPRKTDFGAFSSKISYSRLLFPSYGKLFRTKDTKTSKAPASGHRFLYLIPSA